MENSSMSPNTAFVAQSLLTSSEEPSTEFSSSIFIFHLLIVFDIVEDNKSRTLTSPFAAANLLFRASCNDTELMAIFTLNDNVSFGLDQKLLDFEVSSKVFIFSKFSFDVAQVFNR